MYVRIKFKSAAAAEIAASKLPVAIQDKWSIVKDRTTDAYLEIPEDYEDYVERYLKKD